MIDIIYNHSCWIQSTAEYVHSLDGTANGINSRGTQYSNFRETDRTRRGTVTKSLRTCLSKGGDSATGIGTREEVVGQRTCGSLLSFLEQDTVCSVGPLQTSYRTKSHKRWRCTRDQASGKERYASLCVWSTKNWPKLIWLEHTLLHAQFKLHLLGPYPQPRTCQLQNLQSVTRGSRSHPSLMQTQLP